MIVLVTFNDDQRKVLKSSLSRYFIVVNSIYEKGINIIRLHEMTYIEYTECLLRMGYICYFTIVCMIYSSHSISLFFNVK